MDPFILQQQRWRPSMSIVLRPRRCHCTRQPLVYGCSPHSPVLRPACGLLRGQMQFTAVLSDHVDPSFLLSSPLSFSMYIAVVCYLGYRSFFIRIRCLKYRIRLFCFLFIIPILIFSLLNISLFLILSLLVPPSIFRRHAISNTLSLCFCFSFSVHVSALDSRVLNTSTSYMRVFVALLSSLEFHTLPSACQVPLANPILLSTSLPDPSCVLIFPPRYTKFSVCSNSCPYTSRRNFLFPSPRNWQPSIIAFKYSEL